MNCPKCGKEMDYVKPCPACGRSFAYWFCAKCMLAKKEK